MPQKNILGLTLEEVRSGLARLGFEPYRAGQVLRWVYSSRIETFEEMSDISFGLRQKLKEDLSLNYPCCVRVHGASDTTQKFLFRLSDGQLIETVLIPASPALYGASSDRLTLCVSSQVGCAFGCQFCASGLDGWKRNLSAAEIVGQVLAVEKRSGQRVSNLVFMGMGEPFANYEQVMMAITILNAPWGRGLGARHFTVSTSGLVPKIKAFADQPLQIRLAISLHGATNQVRSQIMPINARYPLEELFDACRYFVDRKKQRITFEYILIEGVNDSLEQARALAAHCSALKAKVNLIPYNTVEGLGWRRPVESVQRQFLGVLQSRGVVATLRREKGHDISAACGQLRLQAMGPKSPAMRASSQKPGVDQESSPGTESNAADLRTKKFPLASQAFSA